jgi:hypothetical protein
MLNKDIISIDGEDIEIFNMNSVVINMDDFLDDDGNPYHPDGLMIINGYELLHGTDDYYAVTYELDIATGELSGSSCMGESTDLLDILKEK